MDQDSVYLNIWQYSLFLKQLGIQREMDKCINVYGCLNKTMGL